MAIAIGSKPGRRMNIAHRSTFEEAFTDFTSIYGYPPNWLFSDSEVRNSRTRNIKLRRKHNLSRKEFYPIFDKYGNVTEG